MIFSDFDEIQTTLENRTILRFSHASSLEAGTEIHIKNLNRILLERNNITIINLYMPEESSVQIKITETGKGKIIHIPLEYKKPHRGIFYRLRNIFCKLVFMPLYMNSFREVVNMRRVAHDLIKNYKPDLVVNHFIGGRDSLILMQVAASFKIPVLVINHFHNSWFNKFPIRYQTSLANAVGSLSYIDVPNYLRGKYINLSNGIDTDFFDPSLVQLSLKSEFKVPVLLLPARVVRNKGHLDLLEIALGLKKSGLDTSVIFAGRFYSVRYKKQLENFIDSNDMGSYVFFCGMVTQQLLRQLYAKASLLVFPTYHDEGIPRVVLEAQAMECPVVCYGSGGTSQALLDNETGFCVETGNKAALKEKTVILLRNENFRLNMGKKGRDFVEQNFSLPALAQKHEFAYASLIERSQRN